MPLVLAIEPDRKQATAVRRLIRDRDLAELVLVDTKDAAVAAISEAVPDLILVTALLSPHEEEELNGYLRKLGEATHLQTLTIPQIASAAPRRGGFFKPRTRRGKKTQPEGCAPAVFADEIATYLERAVDVKESVADEQARQADDFFADAQEEAVEYEAGEPTTVHDDRPALVDGLTPEFIVAPSTNLPVDAGALATTAEPETAPPELPDAMRGPAVVEPATTEAMTVTEEPQPSLQQVADALLQDDSSNLALEAKALAKVDEASIPVADSSAEALSEVVEHEAGEPTTVRDDRAALVDGLTPEFTAVQSTDLPVDAGALATTGRTDAEPETAPPELPEAMLGPEVVEPAAAEAVTVTEEPQPILQQVVDVLLQDDSSSLALEAKALAKVDETSIPVGDSSAEALPEVVELEAGEPTTVRDDRVALVDGLTPEFTAVQSADLPVDAGALATTERTDAEPETAPPELPEAMLGPEVVEPAAAEAVTVTEEPQPILQQVVDALLQGDSSSQFDHDDWVHVRFVR